MNSHIFNIIHFSLALSLCLAGLEIILEFVDVPRSLWFDYRLRGRQYGRNCDIHYRLGEELSQGTASLGKVIHLMFERRVNSRISFTVLPRFGYENIKCEYVSKCQILNIPKFQDKGI